MIKCRNRGDVDLVYLWFTSILFGSKRFGEKMMTFMFCLVAEKMYIGKEIKILNLRIFTGLGTPKSKNLFSTENNTAV